ncbi:MAG: hypothetical protein V8Q87_13105 [Blautia wexlerae]
MERKRFLAVVMTVMMVISMIPSMVFAAAPSGELGGKLKIKGLAAVGVVLSADYAKVTPEEVTDEDFTFSWSRQTGEKELTQVGTEKTYTITQDDLSLTAQRKLQIKLQIKQRMFRRQKRRRMQRTRMMWKMHSRSCPMKQ